MINPGWDGHDEACINCSAISLTCEPICSGEVLLAAMRNAATQAAFVRYVSFASCTEYMASGF